MSNTINYIKTAKGYSFERVTETATMFYCEQLDIYGILCKHSEFMTDPLYCDDYVWAGKIIESY